MAGDYVYYSDDSGLTLTCEVYYRSGDNMVLRSLGAMTEAENIPKNALRTTLTTLLATLRYIFRRMRSRKTETLIISLVQSLCLYKLFRLPRRRSCIFIPTLKEMCDFTFNTGRF